MALVWSTGSDSAGSRIIDTTSIDRVGSPSLLREKQQRQARADQRLRGAETRITVPTARVRLLFGQQELRRPGFPIDIADLVAARSRRGLAERLEGVMAKPVRLQIRRLCIQAPLVVPFPRPRDGLIDPRREQRGQREQRVQDSLNRGFFSFPKSTTPDPFDQRRHCSRLPPSSVSFASWKTRTLPPEPGLNSTSASHPRPNPPATSILPGERGASDSLELHCYLASYCVLISL